MFGRWSGWLFIAMLLLVPGGNVRVEQEKEQNRIATVYCVMITPGGRQVPSPGGKMDGGGTLRGQYKRITR